MLIKDKQLQQFFLILNICRKNKIKKKKENKIKKKRK